MGDPPQESPRGWDRDRTLAFLAMGLCGLDGLIYLFGGRVMDLLLAILFAASAVGLRNLKKWAGKLAASVAVISILLEIMMVLGNRREPAGTVLRVLLHICLLVLLSTIWERLSGPQEESRVSGRGAV